MLAATFVAILFVPLFFRLLTRRHRPGPAAQEARSPAD
jgi:hypothetical protein